MKKSRFSAGLLAISSELDSYGVAHKLVSASGPASIWIVRGPKGRTQNECPKTALAEYVKLYGSRGNITVSENKREGDFLAFTAGCKSFKGTVKEVMPKLEAECK